MGEFLKRFSERRELLTRGREYLFKGLSPSTFSHYFQVGGIVPHPYTVANRETWVSNDVFRALKFAGTKPLENGTCFAVIDSAVLNRNALNPVLSLERVISPTLRDYSGDEIVRWNELLRLFVVPKTLAVIQTAFRQVEQPTISWEEFMERVHVIEPGTQPLREHLIDFIKVGTANTLPRLRRTASRII